jgi:hypothetical protein
MNAECGRLAWRLSRRAITLAYRCITALAQNPVSLTSFYHISMAQTARVKCLSSLKPHEVLLVLFGTPGETKVDCSQAMPRRQGLPSRVQASTTASPRARAP